MYLFKQILVVKGRGALTTMTFSSEKLCVNWNDFQQSIASSYHDLRKDSDFCDVTLVCEDDQQIEAHRIILAACSPFFSTILKRNKHYHPMIYMRGIKTKDLVAIVNFIYYGEANIYQEDMNGFLALAKDLQLRGLAEAQDDMVDVVEDKSKKPQRNSILGQEDFHFQTPKFEESETCISDTFEDDFSVPGNAGKLVVPLDAYKEDLKAQLESMMVKAEDGEFKWICKVCGKSVQGKNWGHAKSNMRVHIETHIEGLSYPCNQCGKVSR